MVLMEKIFAFLAQINATLYVRLRLDNFLFILFNRLFQTFLIIIIIILRTSLGLSRLSRVTGNRRIYLFILLHSIAPTII